MTRASKEALFGERIACTAAKPWAGEGGGIVVHSDGVEVDDHPNRYRCPNCGHEWDVKLTKAVTAVGLLRGLSGLGPGERWVRAGIRGLERRKS